MTNCQPKMVRLFSTHGALYKNTRLHLCLQVHKPVQELLHRKKCLLADDPELAAAPADGNDGDGDGDDDDDHDDDGHADDADGKESDGDEDEGGDSDSCFISKNKPIITSFPFQTGMESLRLLQLQKHPCPPTLVETHCGMSHICSYL